MCVKKTKRTAKKSAKESTKGASREIIYPKLRVSIHCGDKSLTHVQAKQLLGWEEESDEPFGSDYLLKDQHGKKIRCHNNLLNRSFSKPNCYTFLQEILRGRWRFNRENRIIGETGLILNGQHTLVALVLANQEYERNPEKYDFWKSAPTIETTIAFGGSEDSYVVDTLDTCKPRSLSDVLFRGPFFADLPKKDRKPVSRIAEYAIKLVWARTGVANAYEIRRTHSESIDFLDRHPRLGEAVQLIHDENGKEKKLSPFISPGTAAGLLYLMGSSKTEPRVYHQADNPREDLLDWELWDRANDFWVLLAGGDPKFQPLRNSLGKLIEDGDSTSAAKTATICNAWSLFLSEKIGAIANRKLKYHTSNDGVRTLAECPTVGGIDLGDGQWETEPTPQDPLPPEIAKRASVARSKRSAKKKAKAVPKKKKGSKKVTTSGLKPWKFGQSGWLEIPEGEPKLVKIIKLVGEMAVVKTEQGFPGSGTTEKINVSRLSRVQPGLQQPTGPGEPEEKSHEN